MPSSASSSLASRTAPSQPPTVTMPRSANFEYSISGCRNGSPCRFPFYQQTIDDILIGRRILGIATELVVSGTAGEVRALRVLRRVTFGTECRRRRHRDSDRSGPFARDRRRQAPFRGPAGNCRPTRNQDTSSRSCRCPDRTRRSPESGNARPDRTMCGQNEKHSSGLAGNSRMCCVSPCDA